MCLQSSAGSLLARLSLAACLDLLAGCPCADGCPACVGLPAVTTGRHEDPDLSPDFAIPGKQAAQALLELLLGR